MSIMIVDYGMGNLFSVKKILDGLGAKNFISNQPKDILRAEKLILPGVGSFKSAMDNLRNLNLLDALNEANQNKMPIWGICLGMQLMALESQEGGNHKGLGWVQATVEKLALPTHCRLPHIGWNNVKIVQKSDLFRSFLDNPTFYFTHSYVMKQAEQNEILCVSDYGVTFPVAIQKDNLFGTQFHPEKSQLNGRILVENFLNWKVG